MSKAITALAALIGVIALTAFVPTSYGGVITAPDFLLTFDGPDAVEAPAGAPFVIELTGQLVTSNNSTTDGAQGWSLSFDGRNVTDPPSAVDIINPTTDGTAGAENTAAPPGLRNDGFELSELASTSSTGAISEVVLSFTQPITLPANGTSDLVKFQLQGTAPAAGATETWEAFYVDGLQGTGDPVDNSVTWDGIIEIPSFVAYQVRVTGIVIPEPSSVLLAAAATAAMMLRRSR